jgi:hypothetical protein
LSDAQAIAYQLAAIEQLSLAVRACYKEVIHSTHILLLPSYSLHLFFSLKKKEESFGARGLKINSAW